MDITEQLSAFVPSCEQEEADKAQFLQAFNQFEDVFTRENTLVHATASAWIINRTRDKVLMVYHNQYNAWAWTGGHADGERDLLAVAIREAKEETGLQNVEPLCSEIFSVESLCVEPHIKKGRFVSAHVHLNASYLLQADEHDTLRIKADENSAVKWFSLEEAVEASSEPYMKGIYRKLNGKLRGFGI